MSEVDVYNILRDEIVELKRRIAELENKTVTVSLGIGFDEENKTLFPTYVIEQDKLLRG